MSTLETVPRAHPGAARTARAHAVLLDRAAAPGPVPASRGVRGSRLDDVANPATGEYSVRELNMIASAGILYRLYVIELGTFEGTDDRLAVYVGSTRQTRRSRFREHLRGGFTASRHVRRHGTRLLPALYRGLPEYLTRGEAERAETALKLRLESFGYRVFGGSGRPMPRQRHGLQKLS
jgi:hypothetical protein